MFPKYLCRPITSRKLHPKITKIFSPKLYSKIIFQRYSLFKAAPLQSCSEQLLSLPPRIISESGFPKLLSKTISQNYYFSKQLSVNVATKPQSCSPQLLPEAVLQNCYRKPRPKKKPKTPMLLPEAASKLVRKAVQSCSPKLLPKIATQSCSPALLPKVVSQSCPSKLLP